MYFCKHALCCYREAFSLCYQINQIHKEDDFVSSNNMFWQLPHNSPWYYQFGAEKYHRQSSHFQFLHIRWLDFCLNYFWLTAIPQEFMHDSRNSVLEQPICKWGVKLNHTFTTLYQSGFWLPCHQPSHVGYVTRKYTNVIKNSRLSNCSLFPSNTSCFLSFIAFPVIVLRNNILLHNNSFRFSSTTIFRS